MKMIYVLSNAATTFERLQNDVLNAAPFPKTIHTDPFPTSPFLDPSYRPAVDLHTSAALPDLVSEPAARSSANPILRSDSLTPL